MTELKVSGMTCSHCQSSVKDALEAVPGVTGVEVDLASGVTRIEGEANTQQLVAAVEAAGYQAGPTAG